MFLKTLAIAMFCAAACLLPGQQPPAAATAAAAGTPLFRLHADCGCIRTKKSTTTLLATKVVEGTVGDRTTYQSFRTRTEPDIEIFRAPVEWVEQGESNSWWNYGIADEGDFNGDGQPDYTWYGGDEAGSMMLLFLSSPYGYVQVDVLKTIEKVWEKRFHQTAPDFSDAESSDWAVQVIRTRKQESGMVLSVLIVDHPDTTRKRQPDVRLEIAEAEFMH